MRYQSPDRLQNASIAAFDIRQRNVLTADPEHPFFSVQTGEVRSRGIELEGRARVWKQLDVIAAYTYLDTTVQADTDPTVVGKRVAAVPRHLASLWLDYAVERPGLRGLRVGGGVRYVGAARVTTSIRSMCRLSCLLISGCRMTLSRTVRVEGMARCGACE